MSYSQSAQPVLLKNLLESLRILPGVGPKSAERIAYHLLQHNRQGAEKLAQDLLAVLTHLKQCCQCNNYSELEICQLCSSEKRDGELLCVVETPIDLSRIEQSLAYRGLYFVLMGRLSPLDGIGPQNIALELLAKRVNNSSIKEIILATNYTNEGEITAHYIQQMFISRSIKISRIARGIPVGGELEFVDGGTLAQAIRERRDI